MKSCGKGGNACGRSRSVFAPLVKHCRRHVQAEAQPRRQRTSSCSIIGMSTILLNMVEARTTKYLIPGPPGTSSPGGIELGWCKQKSLTMAEWSVVVVALVGMGTQAASIARRSTAHLLGDKQ